MAEENAHANGGGNFTLLDALKAYDAVLRRHHILPAEDTYYYRFLLKLSLDADTNWWHKFEREKQVSCSAPVVAMLPLYTCSLQLRPLSPLSPLSSLPATVEREEEEGFRLLRHTTRHHAHPVLAQCGPRERWQPRRAPQGPCWVSPPLVAPWSGFVVSRPCILNCDRRKERRSSSSSSPAAQWQPGPAGRPHGCPRTTAVRA